MRFKVGDKVRVREDLEIGKEYGNDNVVSGMLKYRGKIVTINQVFDKTERYYIKQDCNYFAWTDEMLEPVEYTYEDLCKAPVGTKITFENGEVLVKKCENIRSAIYKIWVNEGYCRDNVQLQNLKDNYNNLGKIIKIEEPTYTTVYEAKTEILDEKEREYLSNIIKPFRERVEYIKKRTYYDTEYSFLVISYINSNDMIGKIKFPNFATNEMYKGMEVDKEYSLKELGL